MSTMRLKLCWHPAPPLAQLRIRRGQRAADLVLVDPSYGFPVVSNSVDAMYLSSILLDVHEPRLFLAEVWRISRPNATVHIVASPSTTRQSLRLQTCIRLRQTLLDVRRGPEIRFDVDYARLRLRPAGWLISIPARRLVRVVGGLLDVLSSERLGSQAGVRRLWTSLLGFGELHVDLRAVKPDPYLPPTLEP